MRCKTEDGSILDHVAKQRSIEVSDELLSIYNKAVIKGDDDDLDALAEHHFVVLTGVRVRESDSCLVTYVVELDGERRSPYIRASSKGNGLHDASCVQGIFDVLRKGTDSAAIYKLTSVN